MSNSSDDSDFSESSNGEDDAKMQQLLQEWDEKDGDEDAAFVDSEDDETENGSDTGENKKIALLKSAEVSDASESSEEEEEEEEDEEEESEEDQEEVVEEEVVEEEVSASEESESEESESEEDSEEEEEEDEEESDADEEGDEEEEAEPAAAAPKPATTGDDDEDSVVDDGNIEDTLKKKPKKKKEKIKVKPLTAPSEDDNEEDAAMKALLSEWGGDDEGAEEEEDDDDDIDEDSDVSEREVQLEDNVIDHIVLAAPDLDEAMTSFEKMTGIGAVIAGSINGLGIKCARISFNDSSYIEIIAPDPKSPGPIGQLLKNKNIKELTPFHFAIRSTKTEQLKDEVKEFGYVPDHISMFGGQKDGTPRKWEMLYLYGHKLGGICPFFINWANSEHPCAKLPVVGKLKKFTIRAPEDDPVHKLLEHVGVEGLNIEVGKSKMSFQFSSPEGTVKFATSKAVGFKFPGFDDEEHNLDVAVDADSDGEDVAFEAPESVELLEVGDGDYEDLPPPAY